MASDLSTSGWSLFCNSNGTVVTVSICGSCKNEPSMSTTFLDPFFATGFFVGEDIPVFLFAGVFLFFLGIFTLKY